MTYVRRNLFLTVLAVAGGATLMAACDGGSVVDSAGPPAAVTHSGGNQQAGTVAEDLALPISARVEDAEGNPVEGATVQWQVVSGGGSVTASSTTRPSGQAQAVWTLGTVAGEQKVAASVQGAGSVEFTATAEPGPAAALAVVTDTLRFDALGSVDSVDVAAEDAYGNEIDAEAAHWVSVDSDVASVDAVGRVSAVGNGDTKVIASMGDLADTAVVVVAQVAAQLEISTGRDTLHAIGDTTSLLLTAEDGNGNEVGRTLLEWVSLSPETATIDSAGVVTAEANGTVKLVGQLADASDTVVIEVRQRAVTLTIATQLDTLTSRDGVQLAVEGSDSNGYAVDLSAVDWSSTNAAVIEVTAEGRAVPVSSGDAHIIGSSGTIVDSAYVVVDLPDISPSMRSITVEGPNGCALDVNGQAWCWGRNNRGQLGNGSTAHSAVPVAVSGGRSYLDVESVGNTVCGLELSGQVYCWGGNRFAALGNGGWDTVPHPVPEPIASTEVFQDIEAGNGALCALNVTGSVFCWGINQRGEVGVLPEDSDSCINDRPECVHTPTEVKGGMTFYQLAMAQQSTCALDADGAVWCWGRDVYFGNAAPTLASYDTPVQGASGMRFEGLTADGRTWCAVSEAGEAYCWGAGHSGQLGNGTTERADAPVLVSGSHTWKTVSPGVNSSCGITTSEEAYCWGSNSRGQLGTGTTTDALVPAPVVGSHSFVQVDVGNSSACGVDSTGQTLCWGDETFGALGNDDLGYSPTPLAVAGSHAFTEVSANWPACAIDGAGQAWCWGDNTYGALGADVGDHSIAPVAVEGGHVFSEIVTGGVYACALDESGSAWCWGHNGKGSLGDGTTLDRPTPVQVAGGHSFATIRAGFLDTCALDGAGQAYCWGGQAGVTTPTAVLTADTLADIAIQDGSSYCGLRTDGTLTCQDGDTRTWVSITGGYRHTCGLTDAGEAFCWGVNRKGILGVDVDVTSSTVPVAVSGGHTWSSIDASDYHTCGITTAGETRCWGDAMYGQLGPDAPEDMSFSPVLVPGTFTSLSAGRWFACGLNTGGEASCWGLNGWRGLLGIGESSLELAPQAVQGTFTARH